tara:strand:+ start:707 stop:1780 length:1074 start_codon:yes stop_codon:yes gene_type:complete
VIQRFLLLSTLFLCSQLSAQWTSFSTLSGGGSARLLGLGWDAYGHPGDVGFAAFNPASLMDVHKGQVSLSTQAALGGLRTGSLSYGLPLPKTNPSKGSSSIVQWDAQRGLHGWSKPAWNVAIGADYLHSGLLEERDPAGNLVGTFTAQEITPRIAASAHWRTLTFGLGSKLAMMTYGPYTAQAIALDAGWIWSLDSGRTRIGLVVKNAGFNVEYFAGQRESLPLDVQVTLSQKLKYAPFRWNVSYTHLERWDLRYSDPQLVTKDPLSGEITVAQISALNNALRHIHPSVEAQLGGRIFVQVGYNIRRQVEMKLPTRRSNAGLSYGLSLQTRKMSYQFGSAVYHVAGRLNQFTVVRRF